MKFFQVSTFILGVLCMGIPLTVTAEHYACPKTAEIKWTQERGKNTVRWEGTSSDKKWMGEIAFIIPSGQKPTFVFEKKITPLENSSILKCATAHNGEFDRLVKSKCDLKKNEKTNDQEFECP